MIKLTIKVTLKWLLFVFVTSLYHFMVDVNKASLNHGVTKVYFAFPFKSKVTHYFIVYIRNSRLNAVKVKKQPHLNLKS